MHWSCQASHQSRKGSSRSVRYPHKHHDHGHLSRSNTAYAPHNLGLDFFYYNINVLILINIRFLVIMRKQCIPGRRPGIEATNMHMHSGFWYLDKCSSAALIQKAYVTNLKPLFFNMVRQRSRDAQCTHLGWVLWKYGNEEQQSKLKI